MAMGRLGMETTANLATGIAMEQMFQATSDNIDKRMRETWASSSEVAGICHVLCKHYTKLRPDQAALAGLTFQIGILPILSYAEDNPSLIRDSITLDRVIEQVHPSLGVRILSAWEFPQELQQVPIEYQNYSADKGASDYADLVTVAMLQTLSGTEKAKSIDYAQVKAFGRLGLDPEIEAAEAEDLSDEMEAAMKLFN
jgi:HD-like signal output (HDOD) protein